MGSGGATALEARGDNQDLSLHRESIRREREDQEGHRGQEYQQADEFE